MTSARSVVAIVQARMGSTRMPGKILEDIAGRTMLARVVERVSQSRSITRVVVATSTSHDDDETAAAATALGVGVARGSEDDVLDRFHDAAAEFGAETIVRICADSPFIDPAVCDQAVEAFLSADPRVDYASNKLNPTFPLGLDVEVFSRDALELAWHESTEMFERSHVTVHMYQNPHIFRLLPVTTEGSFHDMRWTVDTPDDLTFARAVFERLEDGTRFGWREIVALLEREPALAEINSHVRPRHVTEG